MLIFCIGLIIRIKVEISLLSILSFFDEKNVCQSLAKSFVKKWWDPESALFLHQKQGCVLSWVTGDRMNYIEKRHVIFCLKFFWKLFYQTRWMDLCPFLQKENLNWFLHSLSQLNVLRFLYNIRVDTLKWVIFEQEKLTYTRTPILLHKLSSPKFETFPSLARWDF